MNPAGASVPRALARERARRISKVRYRLELRIAARARTLHGRSQITFDLRPRDRPRDVMLDWRPQCTPAALAAALATLRVNGVTSGLRAHARGRLRLSARDLNAGTNLVELAWTTPIGTRGAAISRYLDSADGQEYIHTLFVPADASSVFPCFDQPDLKAVFELELRLPAHWQAIANAPLERVQAEGASRSYRFTATEPISTYAFAFAAGPWVPIAAGDVADQTRLWVRRSQHQRAAASVQEVLRLNREAVRYCSRYFAHPFPFAKYDLVAIPHFSYRGMEHAGATFLDEDAVLLPDDCGTRERFRRAQLVFHETAHQWMGDLVTMRWFDDLWLKEGYANLMAYKLAGRMFSADMAKLEFLALKASAYRTDQTRGAPALHQPLADLAAAKSAYGSIVYAKAPAILRATERKLGTAVFRRAARDLVRRHAYDVADSHDLVASWERASGESLDAWARAWILRPGTPKRRTRSVAALLRAAEEDYLIVQPDRSVLAAIPPRIARTRKAVQRMQLWDALWQAVWDAELAPRRYIEIVLSCLADETQPVIVERVLQHLHAAMEGLLLPPQRQTLATAVEHSLWTAMQACAEPETRRAWFDGYILLARTAQALVRLQALLGRRRSVAGLALKPQHRLRIAAALVARGAIDRSQAQACLLRDAIDPGASGLALMAAQPDAAAKRAVFARYLDDASLPEPWIGASLAYFNHPAHAALTRPLLARALGALPELERTHKIFFVDQWLAAFVGSQHNAQAFAIVRAQLERKSLAPSLRLKLLEAADQLERRLRIRARFGARS